MRKGHEAFFSIAIFGREQGREVIADPLATYFGRPVDDRNLTLDAGTVVGMMRFEEWFTKG